MPVQNRIMIFVDHNNIFREFQKLKLKFDYVKLKNLITAKRTLITTIKYAGIDFSSDKTEITKQKIFEAVLNKKGIISKSVYLKKLSTGERKEKEIDVTLATDMIAYGFKDCYDIAVLISGDGDFRPAIRWILSLNKKVEIWSFKKALSPRIKNVVNNEDIFYLDDHLKEIEKC